MTTTLKLPVGIENFEKMRTEGFYYIDKTGLIRELLNNWGEVNLFTRPRRFGKSLNMSMLKYFFEYGSNAALFEGLEIAKERELCEKYMGQFPVISISLKGVEGRSFEAAKEMLRALIGREALRFGFLSGYEQFTVEEKKAYAGLTGMDDRGDYTMSDRMLAESLLLLSQLLHKYYGRKVIILIDEYDVPLDKAYRAGYYDEMVQLVRMLFHQALKTNDSLQFAVLTGCLRISKESIFTGLNNPNIMSVMDVQFEEFFGFTDMEVRDLLAFYGLTGFYHIVKEWYDGYRFGSINIYCPWDVINYCYALRVNPSARPQNYWANTGSNDIIRRFIQKAKSSTRSELEILLAGGSVRKYIRQELTYNDLDSSIENLWSLLFTTGYLTQRSYRDENYLNLCIPNREIQQIFETQVMEWFQEEAGKDVGKLDGLCAAFQDGDVETAEKLLNGYLKKTISVRDAGARRDKKESFYHGILLGLLGHRESWDVFSNMESGDGYSDILIEDEEAETGIVIEVKYAKDGAMEAACREALKQIEEKRYADRVTEDGMRTVIKYGVACYKKDCRIIMDCEQQDGRKTSGRRP